ncbi:MAG TPA: hypothetical protein VM779_04100 [Thermoanaerobaculia bacterium]|nr:hypothetical protein [Thermoanaerobaculia bacterium]
MRPVVALFERIPRPARVPIALYAALAILVIPVFPHAVSPNEYSRWAVDVAIVDFGTVEVTPVLEATKIPITDLAVRDGRYYSNKAPGAALLVLPFYAAGRAIFGPPSAETMRATLTVIRIAGATIPLLILAVSVAAVARRLDCRDERLRTGVTVMLFATPLLAYGLLFFAHALSALTLFGAWALLFIARRAPRIDVAAGAVIGAAVLTEYPNAIPAAVLMACALPRLRIAGTLRVIAGGIPFAVVLGLYNRLAFGSFFSLSSAHEADTHIREAARSGLFGVGLPSMTNVVQLLLDGGKGLLVISPVLLLAMAGLAAARRAMPLAAFVALLAVPLIIILTISGYPYWFGGRTVGARYLIPILPFLALLIAFAKETVIEALLLGASSSAVAVMSLVFPFIPTIYAVPWVSFSLPLLLHGCVAPNLLHFVWRPLAIAVPFAIVAAAVALALPRRRIALLAAGALLWFGIGFVAEQRRPSEPYLRVLTEEVHFERDGAIARAFPPGHPARRPLEEIAAAQKRMPPPGWPF